MFSDDVESIRAAVVFGMGWAESEGASDGMEQIEALAALDRLAAEASRYREALRGLQEQAQWLLDHWTEPAFVRPKMQEAALALARAVLAGVQDPPGEETT